MSMNKKLKIPKVERIYHHWEKWECVKYGFFDTVPPKNLDKDDCVLEYCFFLEDLKRFNDNINNVFDNWPYSCEQFLTNPSINRIAWIGQASVCYDMKIPSIFRHGFKLLSLENQQKADNLALERLVEWLKKR